VRITPCANVIVRVHAAANRVRHLGGRGGELWRSPFWWPYTQPKRSVVYRFVLEVSQ
jgi:hypothetical protein